MSGAKGKDDCLGLCDDIDAVVVVTSLVEVSSVPSGLGLWDKGQLLRLEYVDKVFAVSQLATSQPAMYSFGTDS